MTGISPNLKRFVRRHAPEFFHRHTSYAQQGEDLIVSFCLQQMIGKRSITYLDIGANHPFHLSNTAFFYRRGGVGTLVEPDPTYAKLLRRRRPRDRVLPVGISTRGTPSADLFIFDVPTLNTFSEKEAAKFQKLGHRLTSVHRVPLMTPDELLAISPSVDFLTIDVEGLDEEIVSAIDWKMHRPKVICVETLSYEKGSRPVRATGILSRLEEAGYAVYAQTYINTIFWLETAA